MKKEELKQLFEGKLMRHFGCTPDNATQKQMYKTISLVIRDILLEKNKEFERKIDKNRAKQVYYMSMEFLVGTSLRNNISNLGIEKEVRAVVKDSGFNLDDFYAMEPDAGIGNGGLGRLASCYMDSMSTLNMPCTGFSIRYEFGIFKQKIVDGWQMEFPDNWLELGDVWLVPRPDESYEVKFGGYIDQQWIDGELTATHRDYTSVLAVPYDMMISGHKSECVNDLVLWSAKSNHNLDMSLFSRGEYLKSVEQNAMAESISRVLYPADDHVEGKVLRIKQQYLLVCASLQSILKSHMDKYMDIRRLPEKVAIHINDTHPSLCVPELMRILLDEHKLSWEEAWDITTKTLAYTNHTVMSEALEKWPIDIFSGLLPRIYQVIEEINRRFLLILDENYAGDHAKIEYMSIIANGQVKMANLCLACCHKVNGVSKLHSDILINDLFHDFYNIMPDKFTNVTNGIAYRRWLLQSNPLLTNFLKELIGDKFITDATYLEDLMKYHNDKTVLAKLDEIKLENKKALANYIADANGIKVDETSIFDIQIKRLHEYKRQLLNVMHIIYLYDQIKKNPNISMQPRTFIFAAKASAGYVMAKQIIRLINCLAMQINTDPVASKFIKIVFLEDYRVSLAELIIPAANISEQISIAGKEASGTGNMKLMINGAVTLGTLDGANVEIRDQVGDDNIFIFGMTTEEVTELWRQHYNPLDVYNSNEDVRVVIDYLRGSINGNNFNDIAYSLTQGGFGRADAYMALADFDSYKKAHERVLATYGNKEKFNKMSLVNIAKAGIFSADRSVKEYAKGIWDIKAL